MPENYFANYYLWLKSLHVISVICWMAGMFYLPRLFVYHCRVKPNSEASELFKVMEHKLLRYIINPAMIASFFFGVLLIIETDVFSSGAGKWFHLKAFLLVLMSALHGMLARCRKDFAKNKNRKSERFYRILNEIPVFLMIIIVILAVFKPF